MAKRSGEIDTPLALVNLVAEPPHAGGRSALTLAPDHWLAPDHFREHP